MSNDLPKQVKDIHRQRFGRLIALSFEGTRKTSGGAEAMWRCACDCGAYVVVSGMSLRCGNTRSCGCLALDALYRTSMKHGYAAKNKKGPEYTAWMNMKQRCYNKNNVHFGRYGGRGIRVCGRWLAGEGRLSGFQCFRMDMGERTSAKHSIDRIDRNGDYEPQNCRWATQSAQVRNSEKATTIIYHGEEMTIIDASERFGLPYGQLRSRLRYGWTVEDAIERPARIAELFMVRGKMITMDEAIRISPIASAGGIRKRIKLGWSPEDAILTPRQKTGPKPRKSAP